ncbi:adhesin HecA-like repeat protein, partial [Chitinivorax tropicus]|nr:adhesin HecA-like repeat protein [Chitinivorax tropicus]
MTAIGTQLAGGAITATGTDIRLGGQAQAAQVSATAQASLHNEAELRSRSFVGLTAGTQLTQAGKVIASQDVDLTGQDITQTGTLAAGVDANNKPTLNGRLRLQANRNLVATGKQLSGGQLVVSGQSLKLAGETLARTVDAQATGTLATAGKLISQGGLINLKARDIDQQADARAEGSLTLSADETLVQSGTLSALDDATLTAKQLQQSGTVAAGVDRQAQLTRVGKVSLSAADKLAVTGQLLAGGDVQLAAQQLELGGVTQAKQLSATSQGDLNLSGAQRISGDITLTSQGALSQRAVNGVAAQLATRGHVNLTAGKQARFNGSLVAGGNVAIRAENLVQEAGAIGAGIDAQGKPTQNGQLTLTAQQNLQTQGALLAGGAIQLTGDSVQLGQGDALAQNIAIKAIQGNVSIGGNVRADQSLQINTVATLNHLGGDLVGQQLSIFGNNLINSAGRIVQRGNGALNLNLAGLLDLQDGLIAAEGHQATILARRAQLNGALTHFGAGKLSLTFHDWLRNQGRVVSQGELTLSTAQLDNQQGRIEGAASSITTQQLDNRQGEIKATGQGALSLTVAGQLNNQGGLLGGNQAVTVRAGQLDNSQHGAMLALDTLTIEATQGDINLDQEGRLTAGRHLQLTAAGKLINT